MKQLILTLPILLLLTGCTEKPSYEEIREQRDLQIKENFIQLVQPFASRHNAVIDWAEELNDQISQEPVMYWLGEDLGLTTFELEEALIGKGDRPKLIICTPKDIRKKNEIYFLEFTTQKLEELFLMGVELPWPYGAIRLELILEGNRDLVDKFLNIRKEHPPQLFSTTTVAVIAEFSSIDKPAQLEIEESNFHIVKGRLLDLMFVDLDTLDKE